jgi:hypothetical protein
MNERRLPHLRRDVLLVKDLDDATFEAIRAAEPSERSKLLNYLEDEGADTSPSR